MNHPDYRWLKWAQRLQAIAQNGLTYSENPFDLDRFRQVQQVAAEILATYTTMEPSAVLELLQGETGYATPKVDARGAVFQADKILLVKEKADGCWTLPGGWIDIGESPGNAVVREIYEESGYETRVLKLVAVFDRDHPRHGHPPFPIQVYKLFFLCELLGGAPTQNVETETPTFFSAAEIPALSLTRVVPGQIERMFAHHQQPDLPTEFD